ncbi:MAG: RagB/SusD family nutrient uptake outer membrane protein [Dysgonomonas sp.]
MLISIFMLSAFWGCEDLIDLSTDSKVIEGQDIPKNQKDVEALLMGCYAGMRKPLNTEWMLTELRSDNSYQYTQNSTNTTNLEFNDLDMFRPMTTNTQIYQYWSDVFANVRDANLVLKYLDLVTDSVLRNQFEGEARFIRAYHYYNLVQLFGPVPIMKSFSTTDETKKINRSPVSDVYAFIIDDLKFGCENNNLPNKYDDSDLGRITRWSAETLLAKTYLLMKDYAKAKSLLIEIKELSGHKLLDNYADVFSVVNEMSAETIFAIRFKANASGQGSPFANRFSPASSGDKYIIGDGNSYNYPSQDILSNVFETGDLRKDKTLNSSVRFVTKYFSKVARKDEAENDWQVLRFSDVLLMLAEVYNETEGYANAIPLILQVRHRAGLDLANTTMAINSQDECRLAIEKERRAEFAYENQRFYDLVRTNRLITVLNNQFFNTERGWYSGYGSGTLGPSFASLPENKILLPIPQKEIDTSTEFILTQNAGY